MSFWSGEKLSYYLPELISPYKSGNLDCASYRLTVGEQAFVTSEQLNSTEPEAQLVTILGSAPKNMLRISPGQFAFILTEEVVKVPRNALALISMRAKYKFQGLINVSGFHVDPGWEGKLLFSIYNAGPQPVVVERGEALFLIVYGELDRESSAFYKGDSLGQSSIKPSLLSKLTSQVFSPQVLKKELNDVQRDLIDVKTGHRINQVVGLTVISIVGLILAGVALLPSWTGVVIARTLDAAGYEIRQKTDTDSNKVNKIIYIEKFRMAENPPSSSTESSMTTK